MSLTDLHIAATEETPEVYLSIGAQPSFIMGRSLPENAYDFYQPVIKWINEFALSNIHHWQIELRFDYFNSSSGRFLFELLNILENSKNRSSIQIVWSVEEEDDLMLEKGEELKDLIDLNFSIKVFK